MLSFKDIHSEWRLGRQECDHGVINNMYIKFENKGAVHQNKEMTENFFNKWIRN